MANNPSEAPADDFLEQILGLPTFGSADTNLGGSDGGLAGAPGTPMMLQLSSGDASGHIGTVGGGGGGFGSVFPLGLSLEQGKTGFLKPEDASGSGKRFRDDMVDVRAPSVKNVRLKLIPFYLLRFQLPDILWRMSFIYFIYVSFNF